MDFTKYEKMFIDQLALDIKESGIKKEELTEKKFMEFAKARYERNNKLALFVLNNPKAQKVAMIIGGANAYRKIQQQKIDSWVKRNLEDLNQ